MSHGHQHHGGGHGHRFPFEKEHKLRDEQRKAIQPPGPVVRELAKSKDAVVLDLGAGSGYFAVPLAQAFVAAGGAGRVIAADIEPRMLDLLAETAAKAGVADRISRVVVREDAPSVVPIPDASVDAAFLANLWHELPEFAATMRELQRVLRPGGALWIVDWDPKGTSEIGPPEEHRVPVDAVEATLKSGGFASVKRHPLYQHQYVVEARRA